MADFLQKYALTQDQPQSVDNLETYIAFDFLNNSPFDIDVQWGTGKPVALSVPPGSVWRGAQPYQDLSIAGNRWGGRLVFTPRLPMGSATPNLSPAQQLTLYGYVKGAEPPESVSSLNFMVSNVVQATSVKNDGNPVLTQVVEATPQGAPSSELLWNNDGSGIFGGGVVSVNNAGQETWTNPQNATIVLFVWDNTGFVGGHKILLQLTAANELELFDFTAGVVLAQFSSGGGLVLPFVSITAGGNIIQTQGAVSFDNGGIVSNGSGTLETVTTPVLQGGHQETGVGGGFLYAGVAGQSLGVMVNFKQRMTNVPSSITLTPTSTLNANPATTLSITVDGFLLTWVAPAIGQSRWIGTYTTVGN